MDTIYEKTLLFDFYGELLTEKQREICRMYWQEDWSLSEISEALQISRQGVSDALRRSLRLLQKSEQKLRICERFLSLKAYTEKLEHMLQTGADASQCLQVLTDMKQAMITRS